MSRNITDRWLASIKPPKSGRTVITDNLVRGLTFRVTARGTKSWSFRFRRPSDGKQVQHTIGTYPAFGLADARTKALEHTAAVAKGTDPAKEERTAKEAVRAADTVSDLAKAFITRHAKPNKKSWAEDARMIDTYIKPALGEQKAHLLTRREVAGMLEPIAERAPIQANRVLALTRTMFRWGKGVGLVETDPTDSLKPFAKERVRQQVLSDKDIKQFWTKLDEVYQGEATKRIIRLALVTGQRCGEIAGAQKSEIEDGVWTIPGERTKNGRAHQVPLAGMAQELFDKAMQVASGSGFVFPARFEEGRGMNSGAVTRAWGRCRTKLNLDTIRLHDFRRTCATGMAALGIDRVVIGKCLNHAGTDALSVTGSVYDQHSYFEEKRRAFERWERRLTEIIEGNKPEKVVSLRS